MDPAIARRRPVELLDREQDEAFMKGLRAYVRGKIGEKDIPLDIGPATRASTVAADLAPRYDLGVELANDGVQLGYHLHEHGLPTRAVKLARRGKGASWRPLERLGREDVEGKRVLLLDTDIETGRTAARAARELRAYAPACLDLLLLYANVDMRATTLGDYRAGRGSLSFPAPQRAYISGFTDRNGKLYPRMSLQDSVIKPSDGAWDLWVPDDARAMQGLDLESVPEQKRDELLRSRLSRVATHVRLGDADELLFPAQSATPKGIDRMLDVPQEYKRLMAGR